MLYLSRRSALRSSSLYEPSLRALCFETPRQLEIRQSLPRICQKHHPHLATAVRPLSTTAVRPAATPGVDSRSTTSKIAPAEPWRRHISSDPATPTVYTFFEKVTSTWQYIVVDPQSAEAVVVDPVLDYDPSAGTITADTADGLLAFIQHNELTVRRILYDVSFHALYSCLTCSLVRQRDSCTR